MQIIPMLIHLSIQYQKFIFSSININLIRKVFKYLEAVKVKVQGFQTSVSLENLYFVSGIILHC